MQMPTSGAPMMNMGSTKMSMPMPMSMKHKMWMWFHTAVDDTVLFDFWTVKTGGQMVYTCAIIFAIGIVYEFIKFLRWKLESSQDPPPEDEHLPSQSTNTYFSRLFSATHLIQTVLFLVQLIVGYVLMLVFMTFSVWLGIAVCGGAAVGFYLFGARPPPPSQRPTTNENCCG